MYKRQGEDVDEVKAAQELAAQKEQEAKAQEEKNEKAAAALKKLVEAHDLPVEELEVKFDQGVVDISGKTETSEVAEKAALVVGNIKGIEKVNNNIEVTNPVPEAVFHTVVKGEYLSLISKKYYGDAMRYNEIFEANKPMLKDPDLIYPGQLLRIPGGKVPE